MATLAGGNYGITSLPSSFLSRVANLTLQKGKQWQIFGCESKLTKHGFQLSGHKDAIVWKRLLETIRYYGKAGWLSIEETIRSAFYTVSAGLVVFWTTSFGSWNADRISFRNLRYHWYCRIMQNEVLFLRIKYTGIFKNIKTIRISDSN